MLSSKKLAGQLLRACCDEKSTSTQMSRPCFRQRYLSHLRHRQAETQSVMRVTDSDTPWSIRGVRVEIHGPTKAHKISRWQHTQLPHRILVASLTHSLISDSLTHSLTLWGLDEAVQFYFFLAHVLAVQLFWFRKGKFEPPVATSREDQARDKETYGSLHVPNETIGAP